MKPKVLIFGYGNPSRGDDALGPLLLEHLETTLPAAATRPITLELLTDFQLQIEHALDMAGCDWVVFVDAHASCLPPYTFSRIEPSEDNSYTTHALSPAALLKVFQQIHSGANPPPSFLLSIRGYQFELGDPLCQAAAAHLSAATDLMTHLIMTRPHLQDWQTQAEAAEKTLPIPTPRNSL